MKIRTLKSALIDAINFDQADDLLSVMAIIANPATTGAQKNSTAIKMYRRALARMVKENRKNERFLREVKKEEEKEHQELIRKEREMYRSWGEAKPEWGFDQDTRNAIAARGVTGFANL